MWLRCLGVLPLTFLRRSKKGSVPLRSPRLEAIHAACANDEVFPHSCILFNAAFDKCILREPSRSGKRLKASPPALLN